MHPLEAVADVLNGGQVGQPEEELVQGSHSVPLGEELVAEVGQQVEQQGVLDGGVGMDQVLDAQTPGSEALVILVWPLK